MGTLPCQRAPWQSSLPCGTTVLCFCCSLCLPHSLCVPGELVCVCACVVVCGYPVLAVATHCMSVPFSLPRPSPCPCIISCSRRAKWSRREKEKLQAQQAELKKISNEEHITHTSLNLDENDIGPRAPSVHYPQERGPAKTFSEFIRTIKRRATRRHDTEEETPQQQKSSTLPAGVIVSSQA